MKDRGWLIVLSIIMGIILSCAILPLGGFALLLSAVDGSADAGPLPSMQWRERVVSGEGLDRVVIIPITGVIGADTGGFLSEELSQEELLSQIKQAAEDPLVKAVVLRVDSPGGGVVASNELYTALRGLHEKGKPLVVSMGSVAASGGYYVAAAADRIYANADTLTGSLGVIITLVNYEETLEFIGMQQIVFKSGEFKDIGSPLREITPEEQAIFEALIDQAYEGFVDVIVEGRSLSPEEVRTIADGRIYTGQQALDLNLIDELGNLDDAIEGAQELANLDQALVVEYQPSDSLRSLLMSHLQPQPQPDPLGVRILTRPHYPRLEYRLVP